MSDYSKLLEYSRRSPLTFKALRHLADRGAISAALTEADQDFLRRLEKIWRDRTILRAQLSRIARADRLSLLETALADTKWERYAATRLRRALASGTTVEIAGLVGEIRQRFGFTPTEAQLRRIKRIRNRLYVQRHRARRAERSSKGIVG